MKNLLFILLLLLTLAEKTFSQIQYSSFTQENSHNNSNSDSLAGKKGVYKSYDNVFLKSTVHTFNNRIGIELSFLLDKHAKLDMGIYGPVLGFEFYPDKTALGLKLSSEITILVFGGKISVVEYFSPNESSLHIAPGAIFTFTEHFSIEYSYSFALYNQEFIPSGSKFSLSAKFHLWNIQK